jgi:hypothetical protein
MNVRVSQNSAGPISMKTTRVIHRGLILLATLALSPRAVAASLAVQGK